MPLWGGLPQFLHSLLWLSLLISVQWQCPGWESPAESYSYFHDITEGPSKESKHPRVLMTLLQAPPIVLAFESCLCYQAANLSATVNDRKKNFSQNIKLYNVSLGFTVPDEHFQLALSPSARISQLWSKTSDLHRKPVQEQSDMKPCPVCSVWVGSLS